MSAYITQINTAVPARVPQSEIATAMAAILGMDEKESQKLQLLYRATGIRFRHSVIKDYQSMEKTDLVFPKNGSSGFPDTASRMGIYQQESLPLATEAARPLIENDQPTHLITVSCTGMYAPGLDIELIEELDLPTSVSRVSINFMGCYAALTAIKTAKSIVQGNPQAKVLVVAVELCSLHTQNSKDDDSLLAGSLFGDGAAAIWVQSEPSQSISLEISDTYSEFYTVGKKDMAWSVGNEGFEMKLSAYVPDIIEQGIEELIRKLLTRAEVELEQISYFAIHPGGRRILEVIEQKLAIPKTKNQSAWEVLRSHGNMSSPTYLFVLKNLLEKLRVTDHEKTIVGMAFGPGLTLESNLMRVYAH